MKTLFIALTFVALMGATLGSQYVPIPKKPVGINFGATNGQIQIELVYDPVCIFCLI